MSSAKETAAAKASIYSEAEMKLISIAFKYLKSVPEADWDGVAVEYGYKTGALARSKYRNAMIKHSKSDNKVTDVLADTPSGKAKTAGLKRKADREVKPYTGAKRGRKPKNGKIAEVDVSEENNELSLEEDDQKVRDTADTDVEDAYEKECGSNEEE